MSKLLSWLWCRFQLEPVLTYQIVQQTVNVGILMGLPISDSLKAALIVLLGMVISWLTRSNVTANINVPKAV